MMSEIQQGILAPVPPLARHLFFSLAPGADAWAALRVLCDLADGERTVVGLGASLVLAAGGNVDGLRSFPHYAGAGIDVPSTPQALWCWLRGEDRGELLMRSRAIELALAPALVLSEATDTFRYDIGRDLTGYEDGTENPQDEDAIAAAIVSGRGAGSDGGSFVAVQRWLHDFARFEALSPEAQDNAIGRRRSDNEELEDAPESAHVKRTAQESFEPEAFMLRRSMPWSDTRGAGLLFVAFGHSFDAFEVQMRRMTGLDDGIADALFQFSQPVSGAYFWCPPLRGGSLDLTVLDV